jgi:hypothetical protein
LETGALGPFKASQKGLVSARPRTYLGKKSNKILTFCTLKSAIDCGCL